MVRSDISQLSFCQVRERVALVLQNFASAVNVNFLERGLRLSGSGRLRKSQRLTKTKGDSYA